MDLFNRGTTAFPANVSWEIDPQRQTRRADFPSS